jgi:hypothetical protein
MEFRKPDSIILLSGRLPPVVTEVFLSKGDSMNAYMRPMQVLLHPAFDLGRGGARFGGYYASEGLSYRRPIDDLFCTSEEVMGVDGFCHRMIEMGQAMPAAPAALAVPAVPSRTSVGVTAAVVGLSAAGVQLLVGEGLLGKIAFWTEIAALAVLTSVVVGLPENK